MGEYDVIKKELEEKKEALYKLERDYHAAMQKLNDQREELRFRNKELLDMLQDEYAICLALLRKEDTIDITEPHFALNQLFDTYYGDAEDIYRKENRKMDDQEEEVQENFSKERFKLEDDIDLTYRKMRELDDKDWRKG